MFCLGREPVSSILVVHAFVFSQTQLGQGSWESWPLPVMLFLSWTYGYTSLETT